ncbi:MAG: hypothetical protein C0594_04740 [Marinilabiliales bacterium]|nr:MAG: hypothetical protein C0594_04740 [Marinilabiliales bacterium]
MLIFHNFVENHDVMNKSILFLAFVLYSFSVFSQAPEAFKYQAVARDANGDIVANQAVSIRIGIMSDSINGTELYTEEHQVTSNAFGLIALNIGMGNPINGYFSVIDWGTADHFLKVEVDITGGTDYQLMGVSQLLSVPYALHAKTAENTDDADADPQNEIQDMQLSGDTLYMSGTDPVFLENLSDTSYWEKSGEDLYYNTGKVGIGNITSNGRLMVMSDTATSADDVIFSVLNSSGDTVFAVYQEGVRVYIPENQAKAAGNKGGFAVGGFSPAKGMDQEFLMVNEDSVRVYIKEDGGAKATGNRGGFAVGGFSPAKVPTDYYFNIEYTDSTEEIRPSKPRMLWYPQKEAFLTGRVLIESVDSVGLNSFATGHESKAIGDWSQALGYQCRSAEDYATSLGYKSEARALNSYALGDSSMAIGEGSYAFGYRSTATGQGAIAFGTERIPALGGLLDDYTVAEGDYSFAVGMGAKTTGMGSISIGVGTQTGAIGSVSLGFDCVSDGAYCASIGSHNDIYSSASFGFALGTMNEISGNTSMAVGAHNNVSGQASIAVGTYNTVSGLNSAVVGFHSEASGGSSMAIGTFVSTNNKLGSIIFGDASSIGTTYNSADNQFMVRAIGGYVFYSDPALLELNSVYISPLQGNVGIGVSSPERKLHIRDVMRLEPRLTAPSSPEAGDMYIDATSGNKLKVYDGFTWQSCW